MNPSLEFLSLTFPFAVFAMVAFPFFLRQIPSFFLYDAACLMLQFPRFLVTPVSGQFLDFTFSFMNPFFQTFLFSLQFPMSLIMLGLTFSVPHFFGHDLPDFMGDLLRFLVLALLFERLDMVAFLANPLAEFAFVPFGPLTFTFPLLSFLREE